MAALLDTSAVVLLLRRRAPEAAGQLVRAAGAEIRDGTAVLPSVTVSELLVGERTDHGREALTEHLTRLPTVLLPVEAARDAGLMGAFLRQRGSPIPFPDLLIASMATWLDLPLLTWDGDYARARSVAEGCRSDHPGAELWRDLALHPASRTV